MLRCHDEPLNCHDLLNNVTTRLANVMICQIMSRHEYQMSRFPVTLYYVSLQMVTLYIVSQRNRDITSYVTI